MTGLGLGCVKTRTCCGAAEPLAAASRPAPRRHSDLLKTLSVRTPPCGGADRAGERASSEGRKRVLAGFARTTEMKLLLDGNKSQVRALEATGRLRGARPACASETKSTKKFDERL